MPKLNDGSGIRCSTRMDAMRDEKIINILLQFFSSQMKQTSAKKNERVDVSIKAGK